MLIFLCELIHSPLLSPCSTKKLQKSAASGKPSPCMEQAGCHRGLGYWYVFEGKLLRWHCNKFYVTLNALNKCFILYYCDGIPCQGNIKRIFAPLFLHSHISVAVFHPQCFFPPSITKNIHQYQRCLSSLFLISISIFLAQTGFSAP